MNENLVKIEGFDLDSRFNEETKEFVLGYLRQGRPDEFTKHDLKIVNEQMNILANEYNSKGNFSDLEIKEFSVANKEDGFNIPITSFVPRDVKSDKITLFIHGGGWVLGSIISHFYAVALMAQRTKSIFLSIDYRLAPEFKLETQISDCKSVFEWLDENKSQFCSAKNVKLGVSGDSAGGFLSAILTHEYRNLIDYQILVYPVVDILNEYDSWNRFSDDCYLLIPDVMRFYAKNALYGSKLTNIDKISPLHRDNYENLPKCLMILAEFDIVIDASLKYLDKLKDSGVEAYLKVVKSTVHEFFNNPFFFNETFENALKAVDEFLLKI